ncbi:response regulator [Caulobacter endophyticus]|uniref:response regulator n=1 Tax=Caulobacter endophyticus TaxID=2172652 RepID=UPI00240F45AC|nr:response regulator [Caulobacter endophyticus]MDG2529936.1 response regulator [Caulobacter endophyticus]
MPALPTPLPATDGAARPKRPNRRTGALRILIVDDTPANLILAQAVLDAAGHTTTGVPDGAAGVAAVRDGTFDLVLMDVRMPGMDGLAATRAIRALPPPAGAVPILAMTADAPPSELKTFRAAGMNGHVAKPIDIQALLAKVREAAANSPKQTG